MAAVVKDSGVPLQTDDEEGWRRWPRAWWNWRWINFPHNREATGFCGTGASRGAIIGYIAVFSSIALVGLGESAQNCTTREIEFGGGATIKTSSLLSVSLTIEGVVNAILSPILGALTDAGSLRTTILKFVNVSMAILTGLSGLLLFGVGEIWAVIAYAGVLLIISLHYDALALLLNAYVPELSSEELERTDITRKMYVLLNGMQMTYVVVAVGIGFLAGLSNDKIVGPQVGVIVSLLIWAIWALPGMPFLESRPKTEETRMPAGFLGIPRIFSMIKLCFTKYTQMGLFYLQFAIGVTGASSLVGLSSGYFLTEVGFKSFDVQIIVALVLVFSVPGSFLVAPLVRKLGSLRRALLFTMVLWTVSVALTPIILRGERNPNPTQEDAGFCALEEGSELIRQPTALANYTRFLLAIAWGIQLGLIYPINVALFAELCPPGLEVAAYGLRTFFGKVLSWAPPALYSLINETATADNTRFSIMAIVPFLAVGGIITWFIDEDKGREQIADSLHLRYKNKAAQMRDQGRRFSVKDPLNKYDV